MHSYFRLMPTVIDVMNVTDSFSLFSGLKYFNLKCEIACIGALKGVSIALCGIDRTHYKTFENEKNLGKHTLKLDKMLKIWRMRNLTIEENNTTFKTLAISRTIQQ